jgi:hypothetical protein
MWSNNRRRQEPSEAFLSRLQAVVSKARPARHADTGESETRESRDIVFKQGVAVLPHGERVRVAIKDISASGCRIEYFQNHSLEGHLTITEPSIPLNRRAEVIWQREVASGLRFLDQIVSFEGEVGGRS